MQIVLPSSHLQVLRLNGHVLALCWLDNWCAPLVEVVQNWAFRRIQKPNTSTNKQTSKTRENDWTNEKINREQRELRKTSHVKRTAFGSHSYQCLPSVHTATNVSLRFTQLSSSAFVSHSYQCQPSFHTAIKVCLWFTRLSRSAVC